MAAVSLAIVDRDDNPIYCTEFPTKYHWEESDPVDEELFGLTNIISNKNGGVGGGGNTGLGAAGGPAGTNDVDGSGVVEFDCSLKQQFILHTALDRFVHLAGPPPGYNWRSPGATGVDANFVGLLCPVEDFRVYGYATTTKIKIIVVVEDDEMISLSDQQAVDDRIKALLAKIHKHYIEYTLNPFTKIGGPIKSKRFHEKVDEDVETFNRALIS